MTKWNEPTSLESLAAAYAEPGEFDLTVKWRTKAIATVTNSGESHRQRARLIRYEVRKPYRMPKTATAGRRHMV